MSEYSTNETAKESPNNNHPKPSDDLSELRSLLLGLEPTKVNQLYKRLEDPQILPEDVSRMLPEAVILRAKQDKQLGEAMISTIEEAIQSSVKKDQNILANAIFPIIGPATRKTISTALDEMIQSLNQTLENSLSLESFKWRLEARRTGKSFAEIVLLRTLIYRVEQVFLIHKETGLLLQEALAPQVTSQDADLVSAMLTAIQDFIKDSFNVQKGESLQTLKFGELTIWIEEGPQAILAGIIRGKAPQELRLVFQEAIEKIHLQLNSELNAYQGETEPFITSQPYLEDCLQSRYQTKTKNNYTYAWAFLGIIAISFGTWGFFTLREQLRWTNYLEKLNSQPGIVVIKADKRHGKYFISGMRDPLAIDPNVLSKQANISPKQIITQWEPYLSFEPQLITKRANELLQPPNTVSLQVDEKGILHATGSASQKWMIEARKLARFIPGITQFHDKHLFLIELSQLESYKKHIEQEMLFFAEGTTDFLPGEDNKLQNLVLEIRKLLDIATYLGKDVRIQIVGHTDTVGGEQRNILISQNRAQKILSYLTSQGNKNSNFSTIGVGNREPLYKGLRQSDKHTNRRVSFKIFLTETPN